jgi:hypothetical protein
MKANHGWKIRGYNDSHRRVDTSVSLSPPIYFILQRNPILQARGFYLDARLVTSSLNLLEREKWYSRNKTPRFSS